MKMDRKTLQALVLGVLMVGLVVVLITQLKSFGGGSPQPPPPSPAPPQTAAPQPTTPVKPVTGTTTAPKPAVTTAVQQPDDGTGLPWLDLASVPQLVADMAGARDPFMSVKGFATVPAPSAPGPPPSPPQGNITGQTRTAGSGQLPGGETPGIDQGVKPYPLGPIVHQTRLLEWVTADGIKQLLDKAPNLTVSVGRQPNEVVLDGTQLAVDTAMAFIGTQDVPPPPPPFVLTGVVISNGQALAMLSLDGRIYRVTRGQTIPRVGWTVTDITSNAVALTDGRRQVRVLLSGGNQ